MKTKTMICELIPINQKSFYGKAKIIEKNGSFYLRSYDTIIGCVENNGIVHRYFNDKTHTTSKHIASFLFHFAHNMTVKDFYKLRYEVAPTLKIEI